METTTLSPILTCRLLVLVLVCSMAMGEVPIQKVYRVLQAPTRPPPGPYRQDEVGKIDSITFLVSVNDTWGSCFATVKTPMLRPKVPVNESVHIKVGQCDSGPLTYSVTPGPGGNVTIFLTFYSSVIEDASHPTCSITFAGKYLTPTSLGDEKGRLPSVLPGCSVMDSREGYHMTYYWFYIHDWFTGS